jgi:hypothetical protein
MYKYFFCTENGGTHVKHLSRLRKNRVFQQFNTSYKICIGNANELFYITSEKIG